ncbi:hypothetical protein C6P88_16560 [Burkholderia contaminans]|nr:hypothetical protein C6P88_16560 [Burkholderia contaminans]
MSWSRQVTEGDECPHCGQRRLAQVQEAFVGDVNVIGQCFGCDFRFDAVDCDGSQPPTVRTNRRDGVIITGEGLERHDHCTGSLLVARSRNLLEAEKPAPEAWCIFVTDDDLVVVAGDCPKSHVLDEYVAEAREILDGLIVTASEFLPTIRL